MNNSIINTAQINCARISSVKVSGVGIPSSSRSDKPTIDPALKAKLVGVWDCRGKTNEDADRGIIRDRTEKGNHLEILNASYTEGSGYKDGAFVTDGVDDMIVSKNTVRQMVGDSNKVTVISIIRQISNFGDGSAYTNIISKADDFIRNRSLAIGKMGIYGYTLDVSSGTKSVISDILGDKNDYTVQSSLASLDGKLSIVGRHGGLETSKAAVYGSILAKEVLTTDEINQVIAGFDLDWWVEPDGWYDVAKQGITNENHATFNDKLIDFSPNKRDLVCNNFSWRGNSGVGKWAEDFKSDSWVKYKEVSLDSNILIWNAGTIVGKFLFSMPEHKNIALPSFTVDVEFDNILYYYYYTDPDKNRSVFICKQGINILPASVALNNPPIKGSIGFYVDGKSTYAKITQIPEQEGGLWHDGVNDYCQYVGNLGLKDYTVIWDREHGTQNGNIISLSSDPVSVNINTPFALDNIIATTGTVSTFSFGIATLVGSMEQHKIRKISYQSTYVSDFKPIAKGNSVSTGRGIVVGRYGSGNPYVNLGFYGLLLYPYSMNAFLIERQLKKRKFGTLYPKNE